MTKQSLTNLEQQILDTIQDAFPLEERPYRTLAEKLGSDELTVFAAVENLRHSGIIRRIGGIYDSARLGFISRLCAGKIPSVATGASDDSALEAFVAAVENEKSITHNYVRSHEYNVWFTVMGECEDVIRKIVDKLCKSTALSDVHILKATKKYKINTVMRGANATVDGRQEVAEGGNNGIPDDEYPKITGSDRARIRIVCNDIPHTLTPFADWGVSLAELRSDLRQKRMRRFGAIIRHQQAGFAHNAMVCFCLDERGKSVGLSTFPELAEGTCVGSILAKNPHVSHCYERPAFEGFPYNLYAMMHAQSAEDLDRYVEEAAASIGNPDYAVLYSLRELKKTSYRFFE